MKFLIFMFLILSSTVVAYDGVIKDNRGRVINYLDYDDSEIEISDTRGRVERTVDLEDDFSIKDERAYTDGDIDLDY